MSTPPIERKLAAILSADVGGYSRLMGADEAGATADDATGSQADETELAFWDSITDSAAASDYVAYLERYPTGNFSTLARARLIGLTTGDAIGSGDEVKLEITYWESVKESDDTATIRSYREVSGRTFQGACRSAAGAAKARKERRGAVDNSCAGDRTSLLLPVEPELRHRDHAAPSSAGCCHSESSASSRTTAH